MFHFKGRFYQGVPSVWFYSVTHAVHGDAAVESLSASSLGDKYEFDFCLRIGNNSGISSADSTNHC